MNYLSLRILYSPIYPYLSLLLSLILFVLLKSFDSFTFCDNETLEKSTEELKELVKSDATKYLNLMYEHEELDQEVKRIENLFHLKDGGKDYTEDDWDLVFFEDAWETRFNEASMLADDKLDEAKEVYTRIFANEAKISEMDPEYSRQVPKCHYFETSDLPEQNPPESR